jgi:hypothetical protein
MSRARPSAPLAGAIAAAALSFGICFAIVASPTRSAPRAAAARPMREVARTSLTLHAVPALRVRAAVLQQAPAPASPASAPAPAPAPAPAKQQPAPAMTAPVESATTPVTTTAAPTPAARPAPRPRPKLVAAPKRAPAVRFDEAGPQSQPEDFDSSG